jgi:putative ABC transport system substrate-binding protein
MRRRDFVGLIGAAAALPALALAQQTARWPRIVVLSNSLSDLQRLQIYQGLADYGYTDGKNISVEFLTAPTIADVPAYAAQAVSRKPDLILTLQSPAPVALKDLTGTIPVVVTSLQDPVAIGIAKTYLRPAGNFTGTMNGGPEAVGKVIEIAREILPALSRLALLGLPQDPVYPVILAQIDAVTKAFNIQTVSLGTNEGDNVAPLIDQATKNGAQALFVFNGNYLKIPPASVILATLGLQFRLPVFSNSANPARDGMLFGYQGDGFAMNPDLNGTRRSGYFVDLILKGAKPSEIPIEGPTNFTFAVNQKTAKTLGISIPYSVLAQATEVIS